MKPKKAFDCVELKRRGAKRILEQIAGMTLEQELEYWRKQSESLKRRQQELRNAQNTAKHPTS